MTDPATSKHSAIDLSTCSIPLPVLPFVEAAQANPLRGLVARHWHLEVARGTHGPSAEDIAAAAAVMLARPYPAKLCAAADAVCGATIWNPSSDEVLIAGGFQIVVTDGRSRCSQQAGLVGSSEVGRVVAVWPKQVSRRVPVREVCGAGPAEGAGARIRERQHRATALCGDGKGRDLRSRAALAGVTAPGGLNASGRADGVQEGPALRVRLKRARLHGLLPSLLDSFSERPVNLPFDFLHVGFLARGQSA